MMDRSRGVILAASLLAACSPSAATDDSESADTSASETDTASSGPTTDETDATDTTGDGDPNPEVPMVGAAFLIDAHEVRVRDYLKFVADPDGPPPLPAGCEWKSSHIPDQWPDQLGENLDYPVRRIDWCDAWAYCAWAGKHLCGLVGGEPASLEQIVDPIANEWYRACTNDSSLVPYPYGENYDPVRCNGEDGVADLLPVGAEGPCEGGYAFLFDMSGNVWEWTNACADGAPPDGDEALRECRRRGGSYLSPANSLSCVYESVQPRNTRTATIGARCCQVAGGDGDGDPGDGDPGDGDPGDGDPTSTGDGDPTSTGDGDGDPHH